MCIEKFILPRYLADVQDFHKNLLICRFVQICTSAKKFLKCELRRLNGCWETAVYSENHIDDMAQTRRTLGVDLCIGCLSIGGTPLLARSVGFGPRCLPTKPIFPENDNFREQGTFATGGGCCSTTPELLYHHLCTTPVLPVARPGGGQKLNSPCLPISPTSRRDVKKKPAPNMTENSSNMP